jgi:hypothetical protein
MLSEEQESEFKKQKETKNGSWKGVEKNRWPDKTKKSRKNKKKKLVKVLEENPTLKDSLGGQLKVGRPR